MLEDAVAERKMRVSMPFFQRPPRGALIVPLSETSAAASRDADSAHRSNYEDLTTSASDGQERSSSALARDPMATGIGMARFYQKVLKHRAYNQNQMLDGFIDALSDY